MAFQQLEDKDGVRFSWNVWPDNKVDAARMAVPLGCMYTPLKQTENLATVNYPPIRCKQATCQSVLNPYCRVDLMNKIWVCPFCMTRNHFPHHYADISPDNLPAEIIANYTTIEYVIDGNSSGPPIFIFVIDTCVIEEELEAVKKGLLQSLMLLPQNALVGLITFGKNVQVYELAFQECLKSFVFRGSKPIESSAHVTNLLGLHAGSQGAQNPQQIQEIVEANAARFLMPVSECEFQLTSILEDLTPDEWHVPTGKRPERCSGTAMSVAIGLLDSACKRKNARVMMFTGGPPTIGPGIVAGLEEKESLRSHYDLHKGNVPYFNSAQTFFDTLATTAQNNGHTIDVFSCSLDETGAAEMKVCVEKTGGFIILDESFTSIVFDGSLRKVFQTYQNPTSGVNELEMAFGGYLQVLTSPEIKVCGAVGLVSSANQKSNSVSQQEIGVGGTNAWYLGGLTNESTVALYLDVVNDAAQKSQTNQAYMQMVTTYKHSSGTTNMRVTTVSKQFASLKSAEGLGYIRAGFDQEASAVLMTRYAVYKSENEFAFDILRWLDRMLIKLTQQFASYQKDQPDSFRLSPEFSYYPQFMFNLRRSQFLQFFNSSPDETAFFRCVLLRENVNNSLVMIQPTLMSYSLDGPAQPVLLDVSSVASDRILVLDTFFNVAIFLGDTIDKWKKDNVHLNPEYAYFAEFLTAPENDAKALMESRFPHPRIIRCVEGDGQSRFVMAKLNPSITQNNPEFGQSTGREPLVFTEDVSLKVFMDHLRRLVVTSK